jgi:hypothetical protein
MRDLAGQEERVGMELEAATHQRTVRYLLSYSDGYHPALVFLLACHHTEYSGKGSIQRASVAGSVSPPATGRVSRTCSAQWKRSGEVDGCGEPESGAIAVEGTLRLMLEMPRRFFTASRYPLFCWASSPPLHAAVYLCLLPLTSCLHFFASLVGRFIV